MRKWNKENCNEESLKYKRKIDFLKGNKLAYGASYRHGWLEEICKHMEISGVKYNRCIYAYEFEDDYAYIGLTSNLENRDTQHKANIKSNSSCVQKHIRLTGLIPNLIKLSDYIYYEDAERLEGDYIEKYKNDGWIILNINKAGSLGASNLIYTKEKCKEIIDKCVYLSDLYTKSSRIISICKQNSWFIEEINNLIKHKKSNNYWNKENCTIEAKLYNDINDFIKKSGSAYRSSLNNKWLEQITIHMHISKKGKGYWTKEKCKEEASKYNGRFAFQKGSRGAYKSAYINKWLSEFFQ